METENQERKNIYEEGIKKVVEPVRDIFATGFEDVIRFVKKPWRLIWINFLIGIARGLGFFLGVTILGACILVALNKMVDLPVLGKHIANIVNAVQEQLANMPR
ncbi:MAG: hypothetical protein BWY26_01015 [Elusimicrobia bacterium ADurb.Bin231]|nr:MAG: hypothetical protein BWY26_01015 [Elusimicrobia bacterium ADurb.Bin231]